MTERYFGTDGVRGEVGQRPMTVDFALRLAGAAARVLAPDGGRVLIGKDTRLSGYMFESALEAGFVAAGVDVMLIGPLPTPGIAYMTQRLGCSFGVVISASHNPYQDNGIKFFDSSGSKLPDAVERQIESLIDGPVLTRQSQHLGRALASTAAARSTRNFAPRRYPSAWICGASRSSSIAPTAPGTKWRRVYWPIWARKSCRSAVRRTDATSTTPAARPRRSCCS